MRIAIVYSTKYNTVKSCVDKLSMGFKDHSVTIFPIKLSKDIPLEQFDAIILGGSIYIGKTQKELSDFCKTKISELQTKKLGIFLCSAFAAPEEFLLNFPESLLKHSLVTQNVGYEMHHKDYTFLEKAMIKMIPAKNLRPQGIDDAKIHEFIYQFLT
jgi:menaquinone-dependent protoporphyrinogen oxidase